MTRGRFPFAPLPKYPHMKPEDVAVWHRFVSGNSGYFERCDYDVPVGTGEDFGDGHDENILRDGKILTQRKVDVVAFKGDTVFVIEVKPIANMRGLGQILTYRDEYSDDHPTDLDVRGMLVAGRMERGLDGLYAKHGITVLIA